MNVFCFFFAATDHQGCRELGSIVPWRKAKAGEPYISTRVGMTYRITDDFHNYVDELLIQPLSKLAPRLAVGASTVADEEFHSLCSRFICKEIGLGHEAATAAVARATAYWNDGEKAADERAMDGFGLMVGDLQSQGSDESEESGAGVAQGRHVCRGRESL
jgi:hypothetical protein